MGNGAGKDEERGAEPRRCTRPTTDIIARTTLSRTICGAVCHREAKNWTQRATAETWKMTRSGWRLEDGE